MTSSPTEETASASSELLDIDSLLDEGDSDDEGFDEAVDLMELALDLTGPGSDDDGADDEDDEDAGSGRDDASLEQMAEDEETAADEDDEDDAEAVRALRNRRSNQAPATSDEEPDDESDEPATQDEPDEDDVIPFSAIEIGEVLPQQANEFLCIRCFLVQHQSRRATAEADVCRDCE